MLPRGHVIALARSLTLESKPDATTVTTYSSGPVWARSMVAGVPAQQDLGGGARILHRDAERARRVVARAGREQAEGEVASDDDRQHVVQGAVATDDHDGVDAGLDGLA